MGPVNGRTAKATVHWLQYPLLSFLWRRTDAKTNYVEFGSTAIALRFYWTDSDDCKFIYSEQNPACSFINRLMCILINKLALLLKYRLMHSFVWNRLCRPSDINYLNVFRGQRCQNKAFVHFCICIYVDRLIVSPRKAGVGCYSGSHFFGSIACVNKCCRYRTFVVIVDVGLLCKLLAISEQWPMGPCAGIPHFV